MKKIFCLILSLCAVFSLCSCSLIKRDVIKNEDIVYTIEDYGLSVTVDGDFSERETDTNFDLQITDSNAYMMVMAYKSEDLAQGQVPKEFYEYHNTELFSNEERKNVTVIEEETTTLKDNKTITKTIYSAEYEGNKNYYASYFVEFSDFDTFAWVLFTCYPSVYKANSERYQTFVENIQPIRA